MLRYRAKAQAFVSNRPLHPDAPNRAYAFAMAKYAFQGAGAHTPKVPLLWWRTPRPGNFGDWLSPILLDRLFGIEVRYIDYKNLSIPHLISIGSIAKFANGYSTIVGAGISAIGQELDSRAKIFLLRGPITAQAASLKAGSKAVALGDPGLLLRRVLHPRLFPQSDREKIAYVPHYIHEKVPIMLGEGIEKKSVWSCSFRETKMMWHALAGYEGIVTSSLHVYIGALSLGIPVALVDLDAGKLRVAGDGSKYKDFALGAELDFQLRPKLERTLSFAFAKSLLTEMTVPDTKLDEVEDGLCSGLRDFLRLD